MGFRFFKRVKIFPGVTLNLSGSGPSISVGPRGLKTTFGPKGTRTTVGLPGTGLSYTEVHGAGHGAGQGAAPGGASSARSGGSGCLAAFVLVLAAGAGFGLLRACQNATPPPAVAAPPPAPPAPPTASERLRAEGLVVSLSAPEDGTARAVVSAAFQALPREDQVIHGAALWAEAFGPPPGAGELRLALEGKPRGFAVFRYRAGKAEYRKVSAAPRR